MDNNLRALKEQLLSRNYFQFYGSEGSESLKALDEAESLDSIVIRIEKSFNCDQYDFRFDKEKNRFIRLGEPESAEWYLRLKQCRKCDHQCFHSEYTVVEFIKLCQHAFEPVSVKKA